MFYLHLILPRKKLSTTVLNLDCFASRTSQHHPYHVSSSSFWYCPTKHPTMKNSFNSFLPAMRKGYKSKSGFDFFRGRRLSLLIFVGRPAFFRRNSVVYASQGHFLLDLSYFRHLIKGK